MKNLAIPLLLVGSLTVAGCSDNAQQNSAHDMAATSAANGTMPMDMSAASPGDPPATQGYKKSMNDMMANMPKYTGEADTDFMRQMKGHHQAAIAMAETELRHGDDPEARALAEKIIRDQRAEIAEIDTWLAAQK